MWKVSACNCSICQIKVRGNIFLCIGAFSRQGAGYARANETASASPKSSMEKQLANRSGQKNVTGKRTRHTARKQDGAYCTRHDYKTPGGTDKQGQHIPIGAICTAAADDCHSLPDHIQRLGVNGYNVRMKTISASVETPPEKQTCEYSRARTQYKQKSKAGSEKTGGAYRARMITKPCRTGRLSVAIV